MKCSNEMSHNKQRSVRPLWMVPPTRILTHIRQYVIFLTKMVNSLGVIIKGELHSKIYPYFFIIHKDLQKI